MSRITGFNEALEVSNAGDGEIVDLELAIAEESTEMALAEVFPLLFGPTKIVFFSSTPIVTSCNRLKFRIEISLSLMIKPSAPVLRSST